jgi:hypothetical protein
MQMNRKGICMISTELLCLISHLTYKDLIVQGKKRSDSCRFYTIALPEIDSKYVLDVKEKIYSLR